MIEAVLWKPAIAWKIKRVHVLRPIRFTSFRRNEVNNKAVAPAAKVIVGGGTAPVLYADEDRAQRNTVALTDVDYLVEASFILTERAGEGDTVSKFLGMFERRLEKGQVFQQPYFGCRECAADVRPAAGDELAIRETQDFGLMLWDIRFAANRGRADNRPIFYWAKMMNGIIDVPADEEAAHATVQRYHETRSAG
jgi:CRISPR-associated protein Cas5d